MHPEREPHLKKMKEEEKFESHDHCYFNHSSVVNTHICVCHGYANLHEVTRIEIAMVL